MLRKVFVLAFAIMFVMSVAAFACGGDKSASKTADVQKTSNEMANCATKSSDQTTSSNNPGNNAVKNAAYTTESNSACMTTKTAENACALSKDAGMKSASGTGMAGCCPKSGDVSKTASEDKAARTDDNQTVLIEKSSTPEKL